MNFPPLIRVYSRWEDQGVVLYECGCERISEGTFPDGRFQKAGWIKCHQHANHEKFQKNSVKELKK